jgi:hypothetical protein
MALQHHYFDEGSSTASQRRGQQGGHLSRFDSVGFSSVPEPPPGFSLGYYKADEY